MGEPTEQDAKMSRKDRIHQHISDIGIEILGFIQEREAHYPERWVPASEIKGTLELNFVAVPKANKQYGEKGWLFAIVARQLEDKGLVEFSKQGSRSFYRISNSDSK